MIIIRIKKEEAKQQNTRRIRVFSFSEKNISLKSIFSVVFVAFLFRIIIKAEKLLTNALSFLRELIYKADFKGGSSLFQKTNANQTYIANKKKIFQLCV